MYLVSQAHYHSSRGWTEAGMEIKELGQVTVTGKTITPLLWVCVSFEILTIMRATCHLEDLNVKQKINT